MKKIIFVSLFFAGILTSAFSKEDFSLRESGYYTDFTISVAFSTDNIITIGQRENGSKREGRYEAVSEQGLPFINVTWNDNSTDRYLYLFYGSNYRLLLYDNDAEPFFNGIYFGSPPEEYDYDGWGISPYGGFMFSAVDDITATSSIKEGDIIYSPDISDLAIGRPWAVSGNGIGEKISFRLSQPVNVYLSNGFISYSRPYLYSQNSRPSKIRVSYGDTSYIFELEDTPHFQSIRQDGQYFPFWENMEIEILDVYQGTRFSDACITSILYYESQ